MDFLFLPLQNYDAPAHYNYIREILENGISVIFNLKFEGGFYPPLFHIISAFFAIFTQNIPLAAILTWALGGLIIFPFGMIVFWRSLVSNNYICKFRHKKIAEATVFVVSLTFMTYPYDLLKIGTLFAYGFACTFIPYFLAFIINLINLTDNNLKRDLIKNLIYLSITIMLIILSQPRVMFTIILILLPFIIEKIYFLWKSDKKSKLLAKKLIIIGVLTTLIGVVLLGIYVLKKLSSDLIFHPENWFGGVQSGWEIPLSDAISRWVSYTGWGENITIFADILGIIIVLLAVMNAKIRFIKLSLVIYVISGILFVLAASVDGGFANLLTAPWYKNPWRIAVILPIIMTPTIIVLLRLVSDIFYNKLKFTVENHSDFTKRKLYFSLPIVIVCIILTQFIFTIGAECSGVNKQVINIGNNSVLSKEKTEEMSKIKNTLPKNARILADPFSGAVFAYSLGNLPMIIPNYNPRIQDSQEMQYSISSFTTGDFSNLCKIEQQKPVYFWDYGEQLPTFDPIASVYEILHNQNFLSDLVKENKLEKTEIEKLYKVKCNDE